LNGVQVVAGSNPVAPTNEIKGLAALTPNPIFLFFLAVPTLCPLKTGKALARLCFPGKGFHHARHVKPCVYSGYKGFHYFIIKLHFAMM
jgi:hypothetical protein